MAGDATENVGRWREQAAAEAGPANTRTRKWLTATLLTLFLLALAAGALYLLLSIFVWSGPRPYLVPLWNARYQRPRLAPIPWMEADRKAMEDAAYFADVAPRGFEGLTLEEVSSQLAALRARPSSDSVVVYAASYALVDPSGAVRILAKDSDPSDPTTALPLRDLLAALKACPAARKLLVLDVNRADPSPGETGAMGTSDGVADLIKEEVAAADDGALLVLASASPGQTSLAPETLGRSLFGLQFCQALDDPAADGDGDGRVSVTELAGHLGRNADRWARHFRGTHQQPFLTGAGADFPLIALNRTRPKPRPAAPAPAARAEAPADPAGAPTDAAAKAATAAPVPEGPAYPKWLTDAWTRRATRWADDAPLRSPRAARRLDATLLRAERDWRGGADPETLRAEVAPLLASIEVERAKAAEIPRPPARSVGQARAFGGNADPALVAPLKALLRKRRDPDPTIKPEEAAAAVRKSADEFLAGLKGKSSLDLALAVAAASAEERFSPEVVTALDSVVDDALKADPSLQRDVIDLRFLHQLAGRASLARATPGGGDWSETTAKTAWDVLAAAEDAGSQFENLAWVRRPLDRADALRHEATVLLLPAAAGMADWGRIGKAWERARDAYEFVTSLETRLTRARAVLARARAVLPGYVAYLESSGRGEPDGLWHAAAAAALKLAPLLTPPDDGSDASLDHLNNDLAEATRRLDGLTAELLAPFRHEVVAELAARCAGDRPDPKIAPAIDAVLSTPFPAPEDRLALLSAARTLDRRLGELPSNEPAVESDGTADSDRADAARRVAARRGRVAADLLALAGPEKNAGPADRSTAPARAPEGSNLANTWGTLSAALADARVKLLAKSLAAGPGGDDPAGAVAPVSGLDWRFNPARLRRDADARAAWNRLGSRYLDDRHDLGDSDQFYEKAGLECLQVGLGSPPEGTLELAADAASQDLTLSADRGEATATARLTWHGPGSEAEPRVLSVVAPEDPRFRVVLSSGPEVKLAPGTPLVVTARVSWNDDSGSTTARPPAGFILRARRADGRSDHLLVPVTVAASSERLRIVLSDDAKQVNPQPFDLRLRPLAARQAFYVHVKNPTAVARNVLVRVVAGSERAGDTVLGESKLTAAAGGTTAAPAFAAAPLKATDPLPPAPADLRLVLVDAATNKVLDRQALRPSIASPLEYLKVMGAEFRPPRPGEPNRLSVSLRAQPGLTGPPCPVELVVARDAELFPALLSSPKGRLSGELPPAGDLTVYAEQLMLDPSASREGVFRLDLDGQKRALSFRTRFPLQGGPQKAVQETTPRVRFSASPEVKPDQPARLNVRFLVDNAPPDAKVEFRLGRAESGGLTDDISPWVGPARQRRVGFDPRGENGALLFEAKLADWSHSFVTAGIRGRRTLQARLLDADGRTVLDSSSQTLTLDDLPPQEVAFGPTPSQVPKGTASIPVTAVAAVPASSVKEMTFFVGRPADFEKAVAAGASVRGKATPGDPSTWAAELPLPATAASPLVVSVRVMSGVDLVGFASQEIDLAAAKPSEGDLKAKQDAEAARPGAIAGKVVQGGLPQPNLFVTLTDLAPKPNTDAKAGEVKTGKDGTFSFKDVKPGKYRLSARNPASLTRAGKDVTVEPAGTAKADMDLFR